MNINEINRSFELTIVGIIIIVLIGLLITKNEPPPVEKPVNYDIEEAMEIIQSSFAGPYGVTIVAESLKLLLKEYKVEPKVENYLKIANDLIIIRKDSKGKIQEMDIINDMLMAVPPDSIPILPFREQFDKSVKKFLN